MKKLFCLIICFTFLMSNNLLAMDVVDPDPNPETEERTEYTQPPTKEEQAKAPKNQEKKVQKKKQNKHGKRTNLQYKHHTKNKAKGKKSKHKKRK